jgi:hypothetical protein
MTSAIPVFNKFRYDYFESAAFNDFDTVKKIEEKEFWKMVEIEPESDILLHIKTNLLINKDCELLGRAVYNEEENVMEMQEVDEKIKMWYVKCIEN